MSAIAGRPANETAAVTHRPIAVAAEDSRNRSRAFSIDDDAYS